MAAILAVLGVCLGLVAFVCGIIILIAAFQEGIGEGLLCLCIPFYILYFAFAKFENEYKGIIVGVWLGGGILSAILRGLAVAMAN